MALLMIDGFEGYATSTDMLNGGNSNTCRYTSLYTPGNITLNSSIYRTTQSTAANSRSLSIAYAPSSIESRIQFSLPNLTEVIFGFGLRFAAGNSAAEVFFMLGGTTPLSAQGIVLSYTGTTGVIGAHINSSASAPGTLLGTASGTYSSGVWYYLEMRVKLGTTTGEVQLRINGGDVLNLSSVNTATGSLTDYKAVVMKSEYNTMALYVDDLYICDTTGSVNNTFLGPLSVYSLMPTSNGSSAQLTPTGAPSNWEAVDELANDTSSYVETNTTGNKDYYNFETLPAGVTTIHGVRVKALSTTTDNGGRKVNLNMKNGASVISSTLRALTLGSWLWETFLSETAPDGSTWTKALVESTESGVEAAE